MAAPRVSSVRERASRKTRTCLQLFHQLQYFPNLINLLLLHRAHQRPVQVPFSHRNFNSTLIQTILACFKFVLVLFESSAKRFTGRSEASEKAEQTRGSLETFSNILKGIAAGKHF